MSVCWTCRTLLRRHIDVLRQLRQRRAHSTNSDRDPAKASKDVLQEKQIPTPNNVPTLNFWQRLGPLTRAAQAYARAQRKRPYTTQVCTSLFIYLCSDSTSGPLPPWFAILQWFAPDGQVLTAGAVSAQSIGGRDYDPIRTARSLLISSISSIPSYHWWVFVLVRCRGGTS
jgi:dihydroorotate dehydrogenase